jgi:hypothetical protein
VSDDRVSASQVFSASPDFGLSPGLEIYLGSAFALRERIRSTALPGIVKQVGERQSYSG